MLIKVFRHGKGSGAVALEYLCSLNPFGRSLRSVEPKIIKGDRHLMQRQIESVPFTWRYSSFVYSFGPYDNPTYEQLCEIIDDSESLIFAGLPLFSHSIIWILHRHAGRVELHGLVPRQEVHSGKSFNAFPPGWQRKFDHIRNKYNYKYGWARPDDTRRARPVQPGTMALINADAERRGQTPPLDPREEVTKKLIALVEQGAIQSRADIIMTLKAWGYELPRIGKDYITIRNPSDGKRIRLKGTLYSDEFDSTDWLAHSEARKSITDIPDPKKAAEAAAELEKAIARTAAYNRKHYVIQEVDYEQTGTTEQGSRAAGGDTASEQWRSDLRRGISTPGEAVPGTAGSAVEFEQGCPGRKRPLEQIQGGEGDNPFPGKGAKTNSYSLPECTEFAQTPCGLGGCASEGPRLETFHRDGVTQVAGRDAVIPGELGRTIDCGSQRHIARPGGNDQTGFGFAQLSSGQGSNLGTIADTFTRCCEKGEIILQRLPQVLDLGLAQRLGQELSLFRPPALQQLQERMTKVKGLLAPAWNCTTLAGTAEAMAALQAPPLLTVQNLEVRLKELLPMATDAALLQRLGQAISGFKPPDLAPLADSARHLLVAAIQRRDVQCIRRLEQMEANRRAVHYFEQLARWAGADKQRWGMVHGRCMQSKLLTRIYQNKFRESVALFSKIRAWAGENAEHWRLAFREYGHSPLFLWAWAREQARTTRQEKGKRHSVMQAANVPPAGFDQPELSDQIEAQEDFTKTATLPSIPESSDLPEFADSSPKIRLGRG